ncbi:MAG: single-stranded-DNA-specific exonuclease RecJ [Leptospirales bacterium]|nr:single-stranded-DNA-specific exonuclease RecJ [Leptospirales bacterium]
MKPEWILPDYSRQEIELISKKTGIDINIISILFARGIKDEHEIHKFLFPELNNLHSPFLLHGIFDAIDRLKAAIKNNEKIAIFGDSDLDGITSLTIIYDLLVKFENRPLIRYPKGRESYGLSHEIIDEFINNKIDLVITVDSGIRDIQEIDYAKKHNIDFIITDHHEPDEDLPNAIIVNPKKDNCKYPFKELAGVGVVFKFVQAFLYSYTTSFNVNFVLIYENKITYDIINVRNGIVGYDYKIKKNDIIEFISIEINEDDYIILLNGEYSVLKSLIKSIYPEINISNIKKIASDYCNLDFENNDVMIDRLTKDFCIDKAHTLEEFGLYVKLFIELQWRDSKKIFSILQENAVLFTIGTIADIMPLIGENRDIIKYGLSVLKRGDGHVGIQSLIDKSKVSSRTISWDIAPLLNAPGRMGETDLTVNFFLEKDNVKIKYIIFEIHKINNDRKKRVASIVEKLKNNDSGIKLNDNIFFYMNEEIIDGLAGLIANRLADDMKKPVIIAAGTDGSIKGSARSYGNFDFLSHTLTIAHLFERLGGHAQAFGFTANQENIEEIINRINQSVADRFIPDKTIQIDAILDVNDINTLLIEKFSLLEPFGKKNETPVFISRQIKIEEFSSFGSTNNHGKFIINNSLQVIGWNMFDKMDSYYKVKKNVDLIYNLTQNEFLGKTSPRLILIDIDFSD